MTTKKQREREPSSPASRDTRTQALAGLENKANEEIQLDPQMQAMFEKFAEASRNFSRRLQTELNSSGEMDPFEIAKINVYIARTIFSKWSIEIMTVLYRLRTAGYSDIKNGVGRITSRILSQKLKLLEKANLLERSVVATRPPTVRYSLTDKGVNIARLAEPVFLYAGAIEELYSRPRFLLDQRHQVDDAARG